MKTVTALATTLVAAISLGTTVTASAKDGEKKQIAAERFEKLDADGDHKLTLQEYIARRSEDDSIRAAKIFAKMDADNDGSVSPAEFQAGAKYRSEQRKDKG